MSAAFRTLLWKDWNERRSLLAIGSGLLLLFLGHGIAYEVEYRSRTIVASYFNLCQMFGWLGAILLAMSTSNGERTRHTLQFSTALPISLARVAWSRLIVSWACLALPILGGAMLIAPLLATGVFEQAELRLPGDSTNPLPLLSRPSLATGPALLFLATVTLLAVLNALYHVTLVSLIGTALRSEEVVGFSGAILALLLMSLGTIRSSLTRNGPSHVADWIGAVIPGSLAISWGYGDWDGCQYTDLELAPWLAGPLLVNGLLTVLLGALFAWRYGRRGVTSRADSSAPRQRFRPRLPSLVPNRLATFGPTGALVWLSVRQSLALCLTGLIMAAHIAAISLSEPAVPGTMDALLGSLPQATWIVGLLWGVMVAAALFGAELKPGLEHFWRSRPITPATWFWVKYLGGLTVLILTLDVLPSLLAMTVTYRPVSGGASWAYTACMPLLHALLYSLAVAFICRWRRAMPAAIAALLAFTILDQLLQSIPVWPRVSTLDVFNNLYAAERNGEPLDFRRHGYPLVYGIVTALTILATVTAARRVNATARTLAVTLLLLVAMTGTATAGTAPAPEELRQRIQDRNAHFNHIHVRVRTTLHREASARISPQWNRPSSIPTAPAQLPELKQRQFEIFRDETRSAWTEFDSAGKILMRQTFDGQLVRNYQPTSRDHWQHGSVSAQNQPAPLPVTLPEQLLSSRFGTVFGLRSTTDAPLKMSVREIDGELLLEITDINAVPIPPTDPTSAVGREFQTEMILNTARNDWPTHIRRDLVEKSTGRVLQREQLTFTGWHEGPVAYPRKIVDQFWALDDSAPDHAALTLQTTTTTEIESIDFPDALPMTTFTDAFPVGARYYDTRDRLLHEVTADGGSQTFIPQPRGLRGAVLVYHLGWISLATIIGLWRGRRSAKSPTERREIQI